MKKCLLYITLSISFFSSAYAQQTLAQRAQTIVTYVKHLLIKHTTAPQVRPINVGYVAIKNEIKDYDQYFFLSTRHFLKRA